MLIRNNRVLCGSLELSKTQLPICCPATVALVLSNDRISETKMVHFLDWTNLKDLCGP